MKRNHWITRSYNNGDEIGYITLMNTVFPRYRCNLERWRWEFRENPFGFAQAFSVFNGEIVGHMGLTCVPIKIAERKILGSQAVDLAVHPNFRHKGIFLEIGKKLMQNAMDRGIIVSYGVPNEPAYRGHLKYGWFFVSEIPVLVKAMTRKYSLTIALAEFYSLIKRPDLASTSKLLRILKKMTRNISVGDRIYALSPTHFEKHIPTSFDERFDKLWKEASRQYHVLVVRNAKYLNWRYVERPHSDYVIISAERNGVIEGYTILSMEFRRIWRHRKGYIVDIFAKSEKTIRWLLQTAIEYFSKKNIDSVSCWMMKNQLAYKCLLERGFIEDEFASQKLICRININNDEDRHDQIHHKIGENWFFTMGDSDMV